MPNGIRKMEIAAGIETPEPVMPYKKGERIKSGEQAREWTGPRPWKGEKSREIDGKGDHSTAKPL